MTAQRKLRIGRLWTASDCRCEMARVYKNMRRQEIDCADGSRLIRALEAIVGVIRDDDFERRLTILEVKRDEQKRG